MQAILWFTSTVIPLSKIHNFLALHIREPSENCLSQLYREVLSSAKRNVEVGAVCNWLHANNTKYL